MQAVPTAEQLDAALCWQPHEVPLEWAEAIDVRGAAGPSDLERALVLDLAVAVEQLVLRLRDVARRDRAVSADLDLSELAAEALWRAVVVKKQLAPSPDGPAGG